MSISSSRAESRVLLYDVSWATFQSLAREARGGRLAYDRGRLEIMSPSFEHENVKGLLGRLIEVFAEELGIDLTNAGSTTLFRSDLDRGIEADECFYIAHATMMRGKGHIELPLDPPPDLAIEVDISSSSIDKLAIWPNWGSPRCGATTVKAFWPTCSKRMTDTHHPASVMSCRNFRLTS